MRQDCWDDTSSEEGLVFYTTNATTIVFSDTTNKTGLIQDCEFLTGLGYGRISGNNDLLATFTRNLNVHYHRAVTMVLESQDEWDFDDLNHANFSIATTDLTTNRDYSIPVKTLKLKRLDVTYNGTDWYRAMPLDANEITVGVGDDTVLDGYFSKNQPKYDLKANSFWLYPKGTQADVDAGGSIRAEFSREVDEFATSDTTQEPGIDKPFHRILSLGASLDWAIAKGLTNAPNIKTMLDDFEARLRRHYGRKEEDRDWQLKAAVINYD